MIRILLIAALCVGCRSKPPRLEVLPIEIVPPGGEECRLVCGDTTIGCGRLALSDGGVGWGCWYPERGWWE